MATQTICFTRMSGIRLKHQISVLLVMCFAVQLVVADEDPYLSAISSEAAKVETTAPVLDGDEGSAVESTAVGPSMHAFEGDLKARYMGTFTFYKRLPRRAREEIFEEYKGGASIDEIRKKIMDRFLN
ncbi:MAG: hypothetical protein KZQ82_02310 [Candidatus Thiodiazotropha sp. (ex Lucinoma annulata)]|nr:hypothetical protein [Candidatus Thiodiazotropha sp. (ex Lucinoma annulata)]